MSTTAGLPDPVTDAQFYDGTAPRRLIAFVIDLAAIAAISGVAMLAFGLATFGFGLMMLGPVVLTIGFLYRYVSIARASATPGMRLAGVELRRADGERFGEAEAAAHTALYYVMFFLVAPQVVSVAMMATGRNGRGLHDLALGSALINRPA